MVSKEFADDMMVLLNRWIEEDPSTISNDFLVILLRELSGYSTDVCQGQMDTYLSTDTGRYRLPRMKAVLGSAVELLREKPAHITTISELIDAVYEIRGPNLAAIEFLAELMKDESIRRNNQA